jgi:hypothetical protein
LDRIARSWDLVLESFSILMSDKELLFLPIFSAIFSLSISAVMISISALIFRPEIQFFLITRPKHPTFTPGMWACLFLFYLVNYFIVIFFNVALVSIASDRLNGGHATLNDGLQTAWERKGAIFQWAFLSATVGMFLRSLEDKMGTIGRLIVRLIGVAWSLATYFVVPLLAAEDIGPVEALHRSAAIFSETWGEELAGGFSFGFIFMLMAVVGVVLPIVGGKYGSKGIMAGATVMIIYWILLGVISSAVQGIFVAALYRYATTKQIPPGFQRQDFANAWQPKSPNA